MIILPTVFIATLGTTNPSKEEQFKGIKRG